MKTAVLPRHPEVDTWIAGLAAPWQREICTELRDLLHAADPELQEAIRWGAPSFDHGGHICWLVSAREWVHFSFPQGALLDAPAGTWEEGPDTTSKAMRTLKFRQGHVLPRELLKSLLTQAVANQEAGRRVDFGIPKPGSLEYEPTPEWIEILSDAGLYAAYNERPPYQRKGWIRWIEEARTADTRAKRQSLMLEELRTGQYMPSKADRITPAGHT